MIMHTVHTHTNIVYFFLMGNTSSAETAILAMLQLSTWCYIRVWLGSIQWVRTGWNFEGRKLVGGGPGCRIL